MKINVRLVETDQQIRTSILQQLSQQVDAALIKSVGGIRQKISSEIKTALQNQPEYSSLKGGQLRYEFGIPDVSAVDSVIEAVVSKIDVQKKPTIFSNSGLKGGLSLIILAEKDISGLIATDLASVFDDKGYYLPWLEWLLLKGSRPLVRGFEIKLGRNDRSRSGNAVMVESNTNWSVPSAFAGTKNNNWFTRALSSIDDSRFQSIIQQEIEKRI